MSAIEANFLVGSAHVVLGRLGYGPDEEKEGNSERAEWPLPCGNAVDFVRLRDRSRARRGDRL